MQSNSSEGIIFGWWPYRLFVVGDECAESKSIKMLCISEAFGASSVKGACILECDLGLTCEKEKMSS